MPDVTISGMAAGTPPYPADTLVEVSVPTGGLPAYASGKALLKDLSGFVRLGSETVVSPQAFIDLAMPPGFSKFRLEISGVLLSVKDPLTLAFSYDGGATFVADATNSDSYTGQLIQVLNGVNTSTGFDDATLSVPYPVDPASPFGLWWQIDIIPGSPTELTHTYSHSFGYDSALSKFGLSLGWAGLSPVATVPPTKARADMIRLAPYGNDDMNPPSSGETIDAGSFTLWGTP